MRSSAETPTTMALVGLNATPCAVRHVEVCVVVYGCSDLVRTSDLVRQRIGDIVQKIFATPIGSLMIGVAKRRCLGAIRSASQC